MRTNFALPLQIIGFKAFKLLRLLRDYLLWETTIAILFETPREVHKNVFGDAADKFVCILANLWSFITA